LGRRQLRLPTAPADHLKVGGCLDDEVGQPPKPFDDALALAFPEGGDGDAIDSGWGIIRFLADALMLRFKDLVQGFGPFACEPHLIGR